jgi:hypothetical protein
MTTNESKLRKKMLFRVINSNNNLFLEYIVKAKSALSALKVVNDKTKGEVIAVHPTDFVGYFEEN